MASNLGLAVVERVAESDRIPFVKALAYIAAADDDVTVDETEMVKEYAKAWRLGQGTANEVKAILRSGSNNSLDALVAEFTEPSTPFLLMQELVRLSHADGDYAEVEHEEIVSIAKGLGLTSERVAEIEAWVERGLVWGTSPDLDDMPGQDELKRRIDAMDEKYDLANAKSIGEIERDMGGFDNPTGSASGE